MCCFAGNTPYAELPHNSQCGTRETSFGCVLTGDGQAMMSI
ncbi:MAG: hypothetical protein ACLR56_03235 [Oscillospiraceae bacterium]